jgi:F-type H+-transporting ATPase subunit b
MKKYSSLIALTTLLLSAPAYAAGGHAAGFDWGHFAATCFNFAIFIGILVKFAGPSLKSMFDDKREKLLEDLSEAKRLREAAEAKFEEYSARLDALDSERRQLLDEYHSQGEAEKTRMVADAKRQVEKMRVDAELVIQQELRKAVRAIEEQAVDMAIKMAEKRVQEKLDPATHNALIDGFVGDLKSMNMKSVA